MEFELLKKETELSFKVNGIFDDCYMCVYIPLADLRLAIDKFGMDDKIIIYTYHLELSLTLLQSKYINIKDDVLDLLSERIIFFRRIIKAFKVQKDMERCSE